MRNSHMSQLVLATAMLAATAAHADVRITEVAPWSSGNSPVGADWFELTNTGTSAVSLAGWSMDDSSATAGSAAMGGVASLAAGASAIFIEGDGSQAAAFRTTWFGSNVPANLQIGHYSGSGVGLSTDGDGVNVFDASNVKQAFVSFGASATGPYATFDNAAGLNGTISQLSVAGVNGAFAAAGDAGEIGSPGTIAAAVPEPASVALMLAGLGLVAAGVGKRRR
jgi:hypothetical protein